MPNERNICSHCNDAINAQQIGSFLITKQPLSNDSDSLSSDSDFPNIDDNFKENYAVITVFSFAVCKKRCEFYTFCHKNTAFNSIMMRGEKTASKHFIAADILLALLKRKRLDYKKRDADITTEMKTDDKLHRANLNEGESSVSSADKAFADERTAARVFSEFKTKITDIKQWNEHSLMSTYEVFRRDGEKIENGNISVGVFIRISIKGSGKYDWIRVIDIYEATDEFIITVKPTFDPTGENVDESVTSHFFTDEATNNFCLTRKSNKVEFYVIGLNEKPNTSETDNALQTVRNVAVNFATYLGLQKSEWEKFCHHFMEDVAGGKKSNEKLPI